VRLAYLINQYPTVSHTFIRREILALEQLGCEVLRISLRGWDKELADERDKQERSRTKYVLSAGVTVLFLAVVRTVLEQPVRGIRALALALRMSRGSERPWYIHVGYFIEACCIQRWLRTAKIEHLHAHFGTNPAEVAMLVHVLGGPDWSFTVHGPEEFDKAQAIRLAAKVRRCAFVVAISSYGRSQLYRTVDYRHWPKIRVVRCGLEADFFAQPDRAPDDHRFVCVGRLCREKAQALLIRAAAQLADTGAQFELLLVGDGEMRGALEALINEYGLANRVQITGWLNSTQVAAEIQKARALVLASFAEGLPVVLMEAMALRRPVIATCVAGIPELVRSGQDGWLVPAGDITALAEAMQNCLTASAEHIRRMGETARERSLARHSVHTEAAKLHKLFCLVENGRNGPVYARR
jgi:glycosyltransferase involved in cell wall biosynthesis